MRELISISVLFIPLIWEIIDDARQDKNKKMDVLVRGGLMLVCAVWPWFHGHSYFSSVALSFAIFFLLFDYLIHIIMLRRRDWFSFLGTTSDIDKMGVWKELSAWERFAIRAGVFIVAVGWYALSARH